MRKPVVLAALSPLALSLASCGTAPAGENAAAQTTRAPAATTGVATSREGPFAMSDHGDFDEPWAIEIDRGSGAIFVTEKKGAIKFAHGESHGRLGFVTGVPKVAYGGQGGMGDFVIVPAPERKNLDQRDVYLSWAEPGEGALRGAAVGRARMVCEDHDTCDLRDLKVIWRQHPKVTGEGHYSHRIALSPDGQTLFVASGDRMKMDPAQDLGTNLGKIVRLNLDGTPKAGNPFAGRNESRTPNPITDQIWSYGHRNILGLKFDAQGRLWDLEHGPRGGDELNLVKPGQNYGWPVVSDGDHYDGKAIPRHRTRPEFAAPAITWTPVLAPGDFIFVQGTAFRYWRGEALIAGMVFPGLVRVGIEGESARELARYPLGARIRDLEEAPDGSIWIIEDERGGSKGRLRRLTPAS
jgi:aldose sugar dehydrogenase